MYRTKTWIVFHNGLYPPSTNDYCIRNTSIVYKIQKWEQSLILADISVLWAVDINGDTIK